MYIDTDALVVAAVVVAAIVAGLVSPGHVLPDILGVLLTCCNNIIS